MSSQPYQMMQCSPEPRLPKAHSRMIGAEAICPVTGQPYRSQPLTQIKDMGDHSVVVDVYFCPHCGAKIKEAERNPHITYA